MAAEIMSFGTISNLYQGLKYPVQKNIGQIYNLPAPVFSSWLHFLTYIRNLCAHHSRIWNRELAIRPKFPDKTPGWQDVKNDRIISFFAVAQYLFNKIHMQQNIADLLQELFREYPQIPLNSIGFQTDWGAKAFWKAG